MKIPVPEFPNDIYYFPAEKDIPMDYENKKKWRTFINKWMYSGLKQEDIDSLVAKPTVDKGKALTAIVAAIRSPKPELSHKMAGSAYLMSEWFV